MSESTSRTPLWMLLLLFIVPVAAVAGYSYFQHQSDLEKFSAANEQLMLRATGLANSVTNTLDPQYKDADGNLVADPPTDPAQLIDPDTLVFSFLAAPQEYAGSFKEFCAHLSQATGKKVVYSSIDDTDAQLNALHNGTLHITAFSTGAVPLAVDVAGFVPIAKLASADGTAVYQMEILVPANSPFQSPADIKELTVVDPNSNAGYKAPLVIMKERFGMLPGTQYTLRYSGSYDESLRGLTDGRYQAVALANDYVHRMLADAAHSTTQPLIASSQIRTLYKSEDSFPTAAIGYAYNLKPELAAKIRAAIFSFNWKGTGLERQFSPSQTKFIPADYKLDWAPVRRIDEQSSSKHRLPPLPAPASPTTAPQ